MEENRTLFSVIKSDVEKTKIIIDNILIMLGNRIYVNKQGEKQPLLIANEASKRIEDRGDGTFVIKTNNGATYAIKIVFQKLSSTGKQSIVNDFFRDYAQYHKIIVAQDYNNKTADYAIKNHTQIFKESSLLYDIISYRDQPKFEILSPKESEMYKKEYNTSEYTIKKLLHDDPVAKYFALKRGEIVRVVRASPTSAVAIDYRIVV